MKRSRVEEAPILLPNEVWHLIFLFLADDWRLLTLPSVCRHWAKIIGEETRALTLKHKSLSLDCVPRLTSLTLYSPVRWIKGLASLTSLTSLSLTSFVQDKSDHDWHLLTSLTNLTELRCSGEYRLPDAYHLNSLYLVGNTSVTDREMQCFTALRALSLSRCPYITSDYLKSASQLRDLSLSKQKLQDEDLAPLTQVESLLIHDNGMRLTGECFARLTNLQQLAVLQGLRDMRADSLLSLHQLTRLSVIGYMSQEMHTLLPKSLRFLRLRATNIRSIAAPIHLLCLPELQSLDVTCLTISKELFCQLPKLSALITEVVNIDKNVRLDDLQKLTRLSVSNREYSMPLCDDVLLSLQKRHNLLIT